MRRDEALGWLAAVVVLAAWLLGMVGEWSWSNVGTAVFAFVQTLRLTLLRREAR